MVINHAELRNAVLNMKGLNIVMSADNIHAENISILMNMILLLRTGGKRQI